MMCAEGSAEMSQVFCELLAYFVVMLGDRSKIHIAH